MFVNRTGIGLFAAWLADCSGYSCTPLLGYRLLSVLTLPLVPPDAGAAALALLRLRLERETRYLMLVHGARMMSSWSEPIMFAPLAARVPVTLNDTLLIRISLPSGDSAPNISRTIVWPIRQTLLVLRTSRSENISPSCTVQLRTSRNSGVVP